MKKAICVLLALYSAHSSAEDYQIFAGVSAFDSDSSNTVSIGGNYFFDPRATVGPLDQFRYINRISNVNLAYQYIDYTGSNYSHAAGGGEIFFDNVGFSADVFYLDGEYSGSRLNGSYFVNDDFIFTLSAGLPEDEDNIYSVSTSYNHQINESDYLGFTASIHDDIRNTVSVSSKYFSALDNEKYIVLEGGYVHSDTYESTSARVSYYVSKRTGFNFGVSSTDGEFGGGDEYSVGLSHFITNNFSVAARTNIADDDELYSLALLLSL